MPVKSGRWGAVNGANAVSGWQVSIAGNANAHSHSGIPGGTGRIPGIRDWTGNFTSYDPFPLATILPGQAITFVGFEGHTAPTTGPRYSGPALVESLQVSVNWEKAEPIKLTYNIAGTGPLVYAAAGAQVLDASNTMPLSAKRTVMYIGDDPDGEYPTEFTAICPTSLDLTLTMKNPTYATACTEGWTSRAPGILDWTANIGFKDTSHEAALAEIDSYKVLVLDLNPDEEVTFNQKWLLAWGLVADLQNLTVPRETGEIIGFTMQVGMAGQKETALVTGTLGKIIVPHRTTAINYWPFTPG